MHGQIQTHSHYGMCEQMAKPNIIDKLNPWLLGGAARNWSRTIQNTPLIKSHSLENKKTLTPPRIATPF